MNLAEKVRWCSVGVAAGAPRSMRVGTRATSSLAAGPSPRIGRVRARMATAVTMVSLVSMAAVRLLVGAVLFSFLFC